MTICQPDGTSLRSMLKIFKLREQYSLLHLCWLNHIHGYLWIWKHRQMTNGFFQYFRTNAFPTQRPKFWVDLQDPFPTNLRHKGGHFSLLPTYIRWKMVSVAKSNSFKWYHEHSEKTKFKHGMLCSYSSLFGLLKNSFPTENHFCVKLQWVRWLSEGFLVGKSLQYCIKQWTFKVQRLNWFWLKVNRFYLLRVLVSLEIIGTVWVSIAYLA